MTSFKTRLIALYTLLVCANIAAGVWAFVLFSGDSVKLGTAILAYSLGLRHAVDADHIAAIDNVTRKLIQDGKRPLTVGFFFALGHSTIVLIAAGLIAFTVGALARFQNFSGSAGGSWRFNRDYFGVSCAVRCGHGSHRYDRRSIDAWCVRMGVRKAYPEALLQHDDHGRLCAGRNSHRGHRNYCLDRPQAGADQWGLEDRQQPCRAF
jgi:hypothetical protein